MSRLQPLQVIWLDPARADHRHASSTSRQLGVDCLPPFAGARTVDIAKDDAQPFLQQAAGAADIVASIANENAVTRRQSSLLRDH